MSLFTLHEQLNRYMFQLFNVISDTLFLTNARLRSQLRRNRGYDGIHNGERCFILGTGPSLNSLSVVDIEYIKSECVFGVNSVYKSSVIDAVVPNYYVLMDNNYWGISSGVFAEIYSRYPLRPPTFVTDIRAKDYLPPDGKAIFLYAKHYPTSRMRFKLHGNISIAMNVIGFSILSAVYMGFKEIYLLGCDYNLFCSRADNHCYDDGDEWEKLPTKNLAFYLKYYHLTTECHYLIATLASDMNVKIINLTEGSLLDAYPRMHISDVFGMKDKDHVHL